jgi:hypothetical protein
MEELEKALPALRGLEIAEVDKSLLDLARKEAESFFSQSKPLLAASTYLSINEFRLAIITLVRANELYLAYYLAKLFYPLALPETAQLLSEKCEKYFQTDVCLRLLE